MVCSWLKVLQQEQAEAAEVMGVGGQRPQLQKTDSRALCLAPREGHDHYPFTSGLLIAHFRLKLAEI